MLTLGVSAGKRIPPRPAKRASTMGLDYRTFVADDGGLGTIATPTGSDDDGEVSAVESDLENPQAAPDDEDCDGMCSDSDDELRSDVEAEELAKMLAIEVSTTTSGVIARVFADLDCRNLFGPRKTSQPQPNRRTPLSPTLRRLQRLQHAPSGWLR